MNGGQDWSDPVDITPTFNCFRAEGQQPKPYLWKVVAVGPGHGIELRDGRLLTSVWLANGETDRSHGPAVIATAYSDDKGTTWHAGEIIYDTPEVKSPNEMTAVELEDGSVLLNIRNQSNRRAVAVSRDGIQGWSVPELKEDLIDPKCFGSSARYSFAAEGAPGRILFINVKDPEHRRNITLKMSEDDCRTWKYEKVIQPGQGAYSDVAVSSDKTIHVLYEQGFGIKALRLNAGWLMNGCELDSLSFDTGKLQPAFRSDFRNYVLDVREETASIELTPSLPVFSTAVMKIGDQAALSGRIHKVSLNEAGETVIKLLVEPYQGGSAEGYGITVRKSLPKGALVGHWNPGEKQVEITDGQGLAFGKDDFTAAFWVMPETLNERMTMLWYGDVGEGSRGWFLRTQSYNRIFFRTGGDGFQNLAATNDADLLSAGKWTHVAVTRRGNEMAIFVDGRKVLTKLTPVIHNVNGQDVLIIGKSRSGSHSPWSGRMQDVRIFNYALSLEEIRLYSSIPVTYSEIENI